MVHEQEQEEEQEEEAEEEEQRINVGTRDDEQHTPWEASVLTAPVETAILRIVWLSVSAT